MNKRQIIASLNKIANELDATGLYTEANTVTKVMTKLAEDFDPYYEMDSDPELTRQFDATENADKFMTHEYTIILKNYDHKEEIMRVPASKVVKGYMFDLKELIRSVEKAGFGPGMEWGPDPYGYESFQDGYYPEVDRENKTIILFVDTVKGRRNYYFNNMKRIPTENPELADQFHSDSLQLDKKRKEEQREKAKMDAFYPEI